MIPGGELIRVNVEYQVAGVQCFTRVYFQSTVDIAEADYPAACFVLAGEYADQFRRLLSNEVNVTAIVVDLPRIPEVVPVVIGGNAPGARGGSPLPAHLHLRLQLNGGVVVGNYPIRNSLKISGISQVDAKQNHIITNLWLTMNTFGTFLRERANLGGAMVCFNVCAVRRVIGSVPVWEFSRTKAYTVPTDFRSLKSRQR